MPSATSATRSGAPRAIQQGRCVGPNHTCAFVADRSHSSWPAFSLSASGTCVPSPQKPKQFQDRERLDERRVLVRAPPPLWWLFDPPLAAWVVHRPGGHVGPCLGAHGCSAANRADCNELTAVTALARFRALPIASVLHDASAFGIFPKPRRYASPGRSATRVINLSPVPIPVARRGCRASRNHPGIAGHRRATDATDAKRPPEMLRHHRKPHPEATGFAMLPSAHRKPERRDSVAQRHAQVPARPPPPRWPAKRFASGSASGRSVLRESGFAARRLAYIIEHEPQSTVPARAKTVVMLKQPGYLTSMKKELGDCTKA